MLQPTSKLNKSTPYEKEPQLTHNSKQNQDQIFDESLFEKLSNSEENSSESQ